MKKTISMYTNIFMYMNILAAGIMMYGCTSILPNAWKTDEVSKQDFYVANDATKIKTSQDVIVNSAKSIQNDAEIGKEKATKNSEVERWDRVDNNAIIIEKKATETQKNAKAIYQSVEPKLDIPWWIYLIGFLILITWLTALLKQWGLLTAIRAATEASTSVVAGTAKGVASLVHVDERIDNKDMPEELKPLASDYLSKKTNRENNLK